MITSSDQLFTSLPLPNDPRTINLVLSGDIMTVETISQYLTRIQTADRYPGLKVIICKPPGVYDIQSFMENSEFGAITFDNYEFTDISDEGLNLVSSNFVLIDNLTTGGSTNALSAQQGVVLKNLIDNITVPDSFEWTFNTLLDTPNSYEDQKDKIVIVNAAEDGIEFKERIYVFDQGTPSTTWNITHTLDKYPSVTIINSAGYIIEGSIQYISKTNIIVSFNSAFSGTAILN